MNLAMVLVLAFACLAKVFAVCTVVQHEKNGLQIDLMEPTLALVLSMAFAARASSGGDVFDWCGVPFAAAVTENGRGG